MSESPKCVHCGKEKAVGFVRTESPTKAAHRDFRLCIPCIFDMERWMENKPNARGEFPEMEWKSIDR